MNFDEDRILNEVKLFARNLTHYSETAQSELFLACYADIPEFLAISGDGIIRFCYAGQEILILILRMVMPGKCRTTQSHMYLRK